MVLVYPLKSFKLEPKENYTLVIDSVIYSRIYPYNNTHLLLSNQDLLILQHTLLTKLIYLNANKDPIKFSKLIAIGNAKNAPLVMYTPYVKYWTELLSRLYT